ncbi:MULTISPECIES: amino acid deaminase/aldolase [unclassified Microbacterium]|uniref:amino acid deaminase/aldolase n=1 Tax=unclassified Microbacterium TaxID=2609290 RepID=UPI0013808948|nr:amino acid deaminase/aldolase [Microbacterium sp. MAH-37]
MLDLIDELSPGRQTWQEPARFWRGLTEATAHLPAPVGVIEREALRHNALDLLVRSGGIPIRVASKSVRVRGVLDAVLRIPGFRGILAFTLAEALWLAETHDDIVVGYPSVDRASLERLLRDEQLASRVALMVDETEHLDLIDSIAAPGMRPEIRVVIDVDASYKAPALGHLGVRRSPLFTAADVAGFAAEVVKRPGFRLIGLQMYEAQIAGQPDDAGADAPVIRLMQARSREELRARRAAISSAVLDIAPLEFINGGGTGSLEFTGSDEAVTEATAGSGLLAGHLFDGYRSFQPAPATAFAFDVVRKPTADIATVLGGGWIASGPAVASRQPIPAWPAGLRTLPREAAGEVQTPLQGPEARALNVGDRVWFRHSKSGEPAERIASYHVVSNGAVIDETPTYRGEGKAFL